MNKQPNLTSKMKRGTCNSKPTHVSFGKIHVIEFHMGIGDNPTTITGVPIALQGLTSSHHDEVTIDEYEDDHHCDRERRNMDDLRLSPQVRYQLALQDGITTRSELDQVYREMVDIQKSRASCFSKWEALVAMGGLAKTVHPKKLDQEHKIASHPLPPRSSRGWKRDAHGIHSIMPRA